MISIGWCRVEALIVLGLDTASWTVAVGLAVDGRPRADVVAREVTSHVVALPALVAQAVREAGVRLDAIQAVAVSIGPGSFTGLRVGLAFAKGLVFAGGLRLATVSTLEALAVASAASPGTVICAALDARKREVYAGFFEAVSPGVVRRLGPDQAMAPGVLASKLPGGCLLAGDAAAAYPELQGHPWVQGLERRPPSGAVVAQLGWAQLAAGVEADPGTVEPGYLRAPDAVLPGMVSR